MTLKLISEKIKSKKDLTINFVGDSITYGMDHCRAEETYVAKFADLISGKFSSYTVYRYDGFYDNHLSSMKYFDGPILVSCGDGSQRIDIIKNGIGGNTVLRALNRLDDFTDILANGKISDLTFLMFGINESLINPEESDKPRTPDEFKKDYKLLIDTIRNINPQTEIVILSATYNDFSVTMHCHKARELASEENIAYIDLHSFWMEHYDENADNFGQGDWLAGGTDSCHPTPVAAELTAKYIFNKFLNLIDL